MKPPDLEPLVCSIEVNCGQAEAFELWTAQPETWWPTIGHSAFGADVSSITIEPLTGGRIFELNTSGRQHDWGSVTSWSPPGTLAFSWHISGSAADATDVTVTFEQMPNERCRVTITHTGWDRLADRAIAIRQQNCKGWTDVLKAFSSAIYGIDRAR